MKIFKFLLPLICVLFVVVACEKDEEEPTPTDPCEGTAYTFNNDIRAIVNSNCNVTGCHDGVNPDRQPMTTYAEFKSLVDAGWIRERALTSKTMPPNGPLSQSDQDKLDCWMKDGAPE